MARAAFNGRHGPVGLADRLKRARKLADLTQAQVAARIGVDTSAVGQWETGKTVPSPTNLTELARLLNVSTDDLLDVRQPALGPALGKDTMADDLRLLEEARRLGVDLRKVVDTARQQRWREENRDAIADANAFIEGHGLWSDGKRLF